MKFLSLAAILVGIGLIVAFGHAPNAESAQRVGRDCYAPWGARVADGAHVMAYDEMYPRPGDRCRYEWRICRDGWLHGSYRHQSCIERN